jgi:hypothetical protein
MVEEERAHKANFSKMFGNSRESRYNLAAYAANPSSEEVDFSPAKGKVRAHHAPYGLDLRAMI